MMSENQKKQKKQLKKKQKAENFRVFRKLYSMPKVFIGFVFLLVFSLSVYPYNRNLALIQVTLTVALFFVFVLTGNNSSKKFRDYIESLSFEVGSASHNSVLKSPFPMAVMRANGELVWCNDALGLLLPTEDYIGRSLSDFFPDFLLNHVSGISEFSTADKSFTVYSVVTDDTVAVDERIYVCYFSEITDYIALKQKYQDDMIVKGHIYIDNLDEITKQISDAERTMIASQAERIISEFVGSYQGILSKMDRDRFTFVMEHKSFEKLLETKMSVLKEVKNIETFGSLPVTLSIGIGVGESLGETENFSRVALDMALGRGGDQAVIKVGNDFTYFGGQNREIEKRTKVRSRIIALSFKEMVHHADKVLVMGHKNADMDSLGSALALARVAAAFDKPAHIILEDTNVNTEAILTKTRLDKDFENTFITESQAEMMITGKTVLVVVDTHRPNLVAAPDLLKEDVKVFLIDHHRKGADFIYDAALTFHEPYASSTCELVVEMLQYLDDTVKLKRIEAESLYAGILLDTQNFSMKTGARTFEAASYLRKLGMDPNAARDLIKTDFANYVKVSDIVKSAEIYKGSIAIAKYYGDEGDSVFIAQAADDLIDIKEIEAAFVIFRRGEDTIISARSNGTINVQVIMEKLGGGGHQTVAGCQSRELTVDKSIMLIKEALDEMEEA
ncbi:MAG: hypothetical protein E7413_05665 [Ruminococcaceae bacterium]|nr:hypothetical protein [Oscillospiraceae bacterium]